MKFEVVIEEKPLVAIIPFFHLNGGIVAGHFMSLQACCYVSTC
jgi:hypothetical protein